MELTYNQFEILTIIVREKSKLSQRNLADLSGLSLGTVNKTVSELLNENLIDNNNIYIKRQFHDTYD